MSLFGTLFGTPAKSKSVQNPAQVWSGQTPYLTHNYQAGQNLATAQQAPGSQFQDQLQAQDATWQNLMSGSENPYLWGMANNAMRSISEQFKSEIMPALLGGGNTAGQLGQERYNLAQNTAVGAAGDAMTRAATDVYGGAWNSGLQAQLAALGESGNVQGAIWQPLLNQAKLVGGPTVLDMGGKQTSTGATKGLFQQGIEGFAAATGKKA